MATYSWWWPFSSDDSSSTKTKDSTSEENKKEDKANADNKNAIDTNNSSNPDGILDSIYKAIGINRKKSEEAENQVLSDTYSKFVNTSNIDSINIAGLKPYQLLGVFGLPYMWDEITDMPLGIGDGGGRTIGRLYADKILSKMPLLILTPGLPSFAAGESSEARTNILKNLASSASLDIKGILDDKKSGKYYELEFAASEYYRYVSSMCTALAYFLKISDETVVTPSGSSNIGTINWAKNALQDASLSSALNYFGAICFYVNAETQVSESFGNDTTQSIIKNKLNEFSDIGRELQFVTGSLGLPGVGAAEDLVNNKKDDTSSAPTTSLGKFINNLKVGAKTIFAGGRLLFPDIWSDGSYSPPSNQINIRLTCPDFDKTSWFFNIGVPMLHLIALASPRSAGPNGYASPFLCRAFYKGVFNVDMGIIGSMSVSRGSEGGWTIDGLPTTVDITLEIKDLYSKFAISKDDFFDKGEVNTYNNVTLLTYLANIAGINYNTPDIIRSVQLKMLLTKNRVNNFVGNQFLSMSQSVLNWIKNISKSI